MIQGIPKISVLVITYKQEDIVGRTLDSLLAQKEFLYEICVSDDCSPDNTWEVLLDYQRRYPDVIKLHRNDPNVGIFENTEYSWSMATGEVINTIAGDDTTPDGWYKAVVELKQNGKTIEKQEKTFGIREISWSAQGFKVNGKDVLLKGGCLHHDNGILGAAEYDDAAYVVNFSYKPPEALA